MSKRYTDEELATIVVDLCIQIHVRLGPGLLEKVYEEALCYELSQLNIFYQRQQTVPIWYKDLYVANGFRYDILIEGKLLIELKSQELIPPVYPKVVRSYLKMLDIRLGLLINFYVELMKDGIKRVHNRLA